MLNNFRTSELLYWFKSYGNFGGWGKFFLLVEFHQEGSATNGATLTSFPPHYSLRDGDVSLILSIVLRYN